MEKSHLCVWLIRLNTFPSKWLKTITSKSIQMDNHQSFMFINMSWNLFCVYVCVTLRLTAVHMTEWTSACGLGQTDKVSQKLTNAQTSRKSIHSTYLCCPWLVDSDKLKLNLLKFRERSEGHCWHGCHWAFLSRHAHCSSSDLCSITFAPLSSTVFLTWIYHQEFS